MQEGRNRVFSAHGWGWGLSGTKNLVRDTPKSGMKGNVSRRVAETQRFQMSFLSAAAPARDIFKSSWQMAQPTPTDAFPLPNVNDVVP